MFDMVLGHLIGDYIFQNDWMAEGKKKHKGLGWVTCLVHCVLYTLAVCVIMWNFELRWVAIVFLSHFLIDKFSFVDWYSNLIGSRGISSFLEDEENQTFTPHIGLRAGLTIFVYVVRDNTFHLMIMYLGWRMLYGG